MKFSLLTVLFVFTLYFTAQAQNEQPQTIPGQYIVTLKESSLPPIVTSLTSDGDDRLGDASKTDKKRKDGLAKIKSIASTAGLDQSAIIAEYMDVIAGFAARLDPQQVEALRSHPDVEQVSEDYYFQLEPMEEEETPEDIRGAAGQIQTCAVLNAGGFTDGWYKAPWIWILDTGIDTDHPDLEVQDDTPFAKSFVAGESVDDQNGHGTHVAGIAAARNNNIGVVGVSAGATVVPVKVLNNAGGGSFSALLSGLNHVATYRHTNDVVNMSIGAYPVANCQTSNPALFNAIKNLANAKVWICMAAGNESCDALQSLPGCFNATRVYTVGSVTCGLTCSDFSNFHKSVVDWLATGSSVYSTFKNGGYATRSGTSMASPVVAGICHARAAAPVAGGYRTCGNNCATNTSYRIAKRQ